MLTQATHLTAQTNTAYHKIGHLIGAAKRWDISAAYCAHTSNTSITAQTNTAYHKMGHLIRAAKRWDISAAYCAHTSNTSITAQTNTAYHKMGHQIRAAKRWGISAAYCAHTPNTDTATSITSRMWELPKPSKRCPTDVPYSTLNGVGATNHNTLSPWHAQDTSVL